MSVQLVDEWIRTSPDRSPNEVPLGASIFPPVTHGRTRALKVAPRRWGHSGLLETRPDPRKNESKCSTTGSGNIVGDATDLGL